MSGRRGSWAAQQLAEFTAAVSSATDERAAVREGVERTAEALEAEVAALVRGGRATASIGWPATALPGAALVAVARHGSGELPVPGCGPSPAAAAELDGEADTYLVVARAGDDPFDAEELTLLRGMARTLALTVRLLRTMESLRKRQRLLEAMSDIQRSISHRAPLGEVLAAIVAAASELLDDDPVALLLQDAEDPETMLIVAAKGYDEDAIEATRRRRRGEGIAGIAAVENRLVVAEDYQRSPAALAPFLETVRAAMAAPVHEDGHAIGSLIVSSLRSGRAFSDSEQATLRSFAEHASMALTDAKTVNSMVHQALHDALTGLPNRALFSDRLKHALVRAMRRASVCAVLFLDLDRFKTVNDSLGHAAGDLLLVEVARRLEGCMRVADTAARLGGDEFAVLLEDIDGPHEAVAVAERINEALRAPVALPGREVFVSASIGIAVGHVGADDLLRHADVAMYRAKAEGKGRYALFAASMQAEVVERLELEGDLQRALDRDEIVVHYQPVVSLSTGALAGFEALARWNHPTRGLVAPDAFIPLAEEMGTIIELGRHVLREACGQAAAWNAAFGSDMPRVMSVNLSGRQLEQPGIVDDVAAALAETGLAPEMLMLEITETVLMQDTEATIARLEELRALGVRLAVDDFGTGYSSLRYLRRFPIDVLKMAKPFVDGLDGESGGVALARAIVDLSASLRLTCVAEGIELPAQVAALRELGCGLGQGFHFARPMPAEDLTTFLSGAAGPLGWALAAAAA